MFLLIDDKKVVRNLLVVVQIDFAFTCRSADHEPLFCICPDEETVVSVDEIYTDIEAIGSVNSDASSSGIISSISGHGSPEAKTDELTLNSAVNVETVDGAENFSQTFYRDPCEVSNGAADQLDAKMGQLNVEDEQEGTQGNRRTNIIQGKK